MTRDPRTEEFFNQLRQQRPRIILLFGIGLFVVGIIATIAFVAGDSSCNAATNFSNPSGTPTMGSFCGHEHGFLTISYLTLVLGAVLIGIGGMILPTLRARDARLARVAVDAAKAAPPVADEVSEIESADDNDGGSEEVESETASPSEPANP
jgi:hypothetical protein